MSRRVTLPAEGLRSESVEQEPVSRRSSRKRSKGLNRSRSSSLTSRAPKTPRTKKASRWFRGRRDAALQAAQRSAGAASATIHVAQRSAEAASATLAAAMAKRAPRRAKKETQPSARKPDTDDCAASASGEGEACTPIFKCECGFVSALVHKKAGNSGFELRVIAEDSPLTAEKLSTLMDFLDTVLFNEETSSGISLFCDLRQLRIPSMGVVSGARKWSSDARRRVAFQERICGGTICVQSGFKFRLAKTGLTAFFKHCPPKGPVNLVTSLDGASGSVVTFGPSGPTAGAAVTSNVVEPASSAAGQVPARGHPEANGAVSRSSMTTLAQKFLAACGGCFSFLAVRQKEENARELQDMKQTIIELKARIHQLESKSDQTRT